MHTWQNFTGFLASPTKHNMT